jgi:fatty acid desaturase
MALTTAILPVQWMLGGVNPVLYPVCLILAVAVSVIAHNHNHVRTFKSKRLNAAMDYWITIFYGFPAFAWIPTHNLNHHAETNGDRDYTKTYRYSEANNIVTLLTYPTISGFFQQRPIREYLKKLWGKNRERFWFSFSQYILLGSYLAVAFIVDWEKALWYIFIPQQVSLFAVLIFNYVQHVHADEESSLNHSRNITGWGLNALLFNNGFHTAHHEQPGLHWSKTPELHAELAPQIDPALNERSFWWYIVRVYILGLFVPRFRTKSMRLARLQRQREGSLSTEKAAPAQAAS